MVLVTGATGLVGSHLLVKLIREGRKIRALYRSTSKIEYTRKLLYRYLDPEEQSLFNAIDWFQTDINDIPSLETAFENVKQVYHCAAWITFDPKNYKKLRQINIQGTANIVNLCLIHKVDKLCHVSSIAALGDNPSKTIIDESMEWNPENQNSVYAITKYGAEIEVWRGIQEGLNAVIVNPGIIIGPGFFDSGSGYMFKRIHQGLSYYTPGTMGYIAVEDLANCMFELMSGKHTNERYILIGENLTYKVAFSLIAKYLNKPFPKREASRFSLQLAYYFQRLSRFVFGTKQTIFKPTIESVFATKRYTNQKIEKALEYNFIPIEEAIKQTAKAYLDLRNN